MLRTAVRGPVASLVLAVAVSAPPAVALETDQYYAWGRELPDASAMVSAKLQLELERAIDSFDQPPETCGDIEVALRKRLRFILFHHIQLWTMNTTLVPRVPAGGEEEVHYREVNLYHLHGPLDIGTWMPTVPTIEVGGVRFGTDKLSHFVSSGWTLYGSYRRALADGLDPHEAERAAVRRGLLEESLILGGMTSGLVSLSDLEAGAEGMRFYRDLCSGPDPVLGRAADGTWEIRRPIDMRAYVTPEWDESYQPQIYRSWRWRKVRPVLAGYCDRLDDPEVMRMRRELERRDRVTVVEEVVRDLVAEGRLEDPWQFTIEAVCGRPARRWWGWERAAPTVPRGPPPAPDELEPVIERHEEDTSRRRVGVLSVGWAYPELVAASVGVLSARLPEGADCRTSCDLWGGFVQLAPGLGGGRISAGYGRVIGELGGDRSLLTNVYLALGVKASLLRTWGEDLSRAPPGQTYLGPEMEFSVAKVNMGLGVLRRVEGDEGDPWLVVGTLGWGF